MRTEEPEGYYSQPFVKEVFFRNDSDIMPTYGHSGGDWAKARKSILSIGKNTLSKRVEKEESFYVTRMLKTNEFDANVGYNKLEFNNTSGRLPVWLCDLTDFDNVCRVNSTAGGVGSALVNHAARPWYVLNFKQTTGVPTVASTLGMYSFAEESPALYFDQLDYRYELETSNVNSSDLANYDPTSVVASITDDTGGDSGSTSTADKFSNKTPVLRWVDFRGLFYGVKSREVKWNIDVVQFAEDYLDPVPMDVMMNVSGATDQRLTDRRQQERLQFWYQFAKQKTAHPLLPRNMGDFSYEKGVRYLARYSFKIRESLTDADQINKVEKKINLRLNKILNRNWRRDMSSYMALRQADIYGDGKGLDDPAAFNAKSYRATSRIHPRSRVYLMISATCPKSDTEGADVGTRSVTNVLQDVTKVRSIAQNVPFRTHLPGPTGETGAREPSDIGTFVNAVDFLGSVNNSSTNNGAFWTENGRDVNPSEVQIPVNGDITWGLYNYHLQQVDDVDIKATGENAFITATSAGAEVQGRLEVTQSVYRNAMGDAENPATSGVLVTGTETFADPGRDNPTFDFILRMKYVI